MAGVSAETVTKNLGPILQAMRVRSGLTQKELAARLGRDHITVLRWENGKAGIPLGKFFEYCQETGGDPVSAIMELTGSRPRRGQESHCWS